MRVIVTGSRDSTDRDSVERVLFKLSELKGALHVIQGGRPGVEQFAAEWGFDHAMGVATFATEGRRKTSPMHADTAEGRMIAEGSPDMVVAFPGADAIVALGLDAGVPTYRITGGKMVRMESPL